MCLTGAWTSYDSNQGDDLCRDSSQGRESQDELIIPFADSPYELPPPFPRADQPQGKPARPRQLWGPLYWFVVKDLFCTLNPWNKFLNVPKEEISQKFEYYCSLKYTRYVKPGGAPGQLRKLLGIQTLAYWDLLIYSSAYNSEENKLSSDDQDNYFKQRADQLNELFKKTQAELGPSRAGTKLIEVWCDMFKEHCIECSVNEERAVAAHQAMIDETE